jgi:hypothetical protein
MPETPYSILDNQLSQLQEYYKDQQNKLAEQRPSQEDWNKTIAGMQSDYDAHKFKIDTLRGQLDSIKKNVSDPNLANEASWRLVVPQEQAAGMFPNPEKAEPRGRFTPGEFETYKKQFKTDIAGAEDKPLFGRNTIDPTKLKQAYFSAREAYGYDNQMNSDEKKAFDMAWDSSVNSSGKKFSTAWTDLKKNDPDVFSSRTYGNRMLNVAAKKVSPLAASIQETKPVKSEPSKDFLGRAPWDKATKSIPEPKTQAEYNALPSGTEYRDTDGKMKRKK